MVPLPAMQRVSETCKGTRGPLRLHLNVLVYHVIAIYSDTVADISVLGSKRHTDCGNNRLLLAC